jgi:hypothetical protein
VYPSMTELCLCMEEIDVPAQPQSARFAVASPHSTQQRNPTRGTDSVSRPLLAWREWSYSLHSMLAVLYAPLIFDLHGVCYWHGWLWLWHVALALAVVRL